MLAASVLTVTAGQAHAVEPFVVKDIRVEGVQRVEPGTVFGYLRAFAVLLRGIFDWPTRAGILASSPSEDRRRLHPASHFARPVQRFESVISDSRLNRIQLGSVSHIVATGVSGQLRVLKTLRSGFRLNPTRGLD